MEFATKQDAELCFIKNRKFVGKCLANAEKSFYFKKGELKSKTVNITCSLDGVVEERKDKNDKEYIFIKKFGLLHVT